MNSQRIPLRTGPLPQSFGKEASAAQFGLDKFIWHAAIPGTTGRTAMSPWPPGWAVITGYIIQVNAMQSDHGLGDARRRTDTAAGILSGRLIMAHRRSIMALWNLTRRRFTWIRSDEISD